MSPPSEPDAHEAGTGLNVEVETGDMGVFCHGVAELDAGVEFVRRLVLRESGISLDTEERASGLAGVGDEVLGYLVERAGEVVYEVERRLAYVLLESSLIGLEPFAVVVLFDVPEEAEELWCEVSSSHVEKLSGACDDLRRSRGCQGFKEGFKA
jgi:hypothetical protein